MLSSPKLRIALLGLLLLTAGSAVRGEDAKPDPLRAKYLALVEKGDAASKDEKYDEALQWYSKALRLFHGDAAVLKAEKAARQAAYDQHIQAGQKAVQEKRYADAYKEFGTAAATAKANSSGRLAAMQSLARAQALGQQEAWQRMLAEAAVAAKRIQTRLA